MMHVHSTARYDGTEGEAARQAHHLAALAQWSDTLLLSTRE